MDTLIVEDDSYPEDVLVIRVRTSYWKNRKGIHIRKDLSYMKKMSKGHNTLEEDLTCIGPEEVVSRILNLNSVKDGLYKVTTCNEKRDYETGCIEDYGYMLNSI